MDVQFFYSFSKLMWTLFHKESRNIDDYTLEYLYSNNKGTVLIIYSTKTKADLNRVLSLTISYNTGKD